jgi:hypothetical protein
MRWSQWVCSLFEVTDSVLYTAIMTSFPEFGVALCYSSVVCAVEALSYCLWCLC